MKGRRRAGGRGAYKVGGAACCGARDQLSSRQVHGSLGRSCPPFAALEVAVTVVCERPAHVLAGAFGSLSKAEGGKPWKALSSRDSARTRRKRCAGSQH